VQGDIVVFKSSNPEEARAGHGHVGLFLEQDADSVLVLGGNQVNKYGHHKMCEQRIKKDGSLIFHSFHSVKAFPRLPATAPVVGTKSFHTGIVPQVQ
jgi:hypothetical protein